MVADKYRELDGPRRARAAGRSASEGFFVLLFFVFFFLFETLAFRRARVIDKCGALVAAAVVSRCIASRPLSSQIGRSTRGWSKDTPLSAHIAGLEPGRAADARHRRGFHARDLAGDES